MKQNMKQNTTLIVISVIGIAFVLNAFSGGWGGDTWSDTILRKIGLKEKKN